MGVSFEKLQAYQPETGIVTVKGLGDLSIRMMSAGEAVELDKERQECFTGEGDDQVVDMPKFVAFGVKVAMTCLIDDAGKAYPPEAEETFKKFDLDTLGDIQTECFVFNGLMKRKAFDESGNSEGNEQPLTNEP